MQKNQKPFLKSDTINIRYGRYMKILTCGSSPLCLLSNDILSYLEGYLKQTLFSLPAMTILGAYVLGEIVLLQLDARLDYVHKGRQKRASIFSGDIIWDILPKEILHSPSFKMDLELFISNALLYSVFAILFFDINAIAYTKLFHPIVVNALNFCFGKVFNPLPHTTFTVIAFSLLLMIAMDFGFYVQHRLAHKVKFFWEFHKVHHSATTLNFFTTYRAHIFDKLFSFAFKGAAGACVVGVFDYFCSGRPHDFLIYEIPIFAVISAGVMILQHSHVWWSWGKLENIFYSPAMHIIHHSKNPIHFNKNLGSVFNFDKIFGTYYKPAELPENIEIGMVDDVDWESLSLYQYFIRPIKRAIGALGSYFLR
ncbi:MAG: hypothetical protein C5B49_12610 [Bdellovibrio sp.]|nr:MAG: hypothetical protein C5B49_12610 [Bdellovibrio sp.]